MCNESILQTSWVFLTSRQSKAALKLVVKFVFGAATQTAVSPRPTARSSRFFQICILITNLDFYTPHRRRECVLYRERRTSALGSLSRKTDASFFNHISAGTTPILIIFAFLDSKKVFQHDLERTGKENGSFLVYQEANLRPWWRKPTKSDPPYLKVDQQTN